MSSPFYWNHYVLLLLINLIYSIDNIKSMSPSKQIEQDLNGSKSNIINSKDEQAMGEQQRWKAQHKECQRKLIARCKNMIKSLILHIYNYILITSQLKHDLMFLAWTYCRICIGASLVTRYIKIYCVIIYNFFIGFIFYAILYN